MYLPYDEELGIRPWTIRSYIRIPSTWMQFDEIPWCGTGIPSPSGATRLSTRQM